MKPEIRRFPNLESLSRAAARFIVEQATLCVEERGRFTLVLSGGQSPRLLYEQLSLPAFTVKMPWAQTYLLWGDERWVPADHPQSNYGMAQKLLIARVPVPAANILRPPAEMTSPEAAARAYEKTLRSFFRVTRRRLTPPEFPTFDLILLGIGKDGHTASLFPGNRVLEERRQWVAAVETTTASPSIPRLTLTLPVINSAARVLFLVSGKGKREVVQSILTEPAEAVHVYPAARVRPAGRLIWFVNEELL
jgi:6-phosphogluconolactonase